MSDFTNLADLDLLVPDEENQTDFASSNACRTFICKC